MQCDLPCLICHDWVLFVGIGFDFGKANYDNFTGSPAYLGVSVRSVILSNLKTSMKFYHEEGLTWLWLLLIRRYWLYGAVIKPSENLLFTLSQSVVLINKHSLRRWWWRHEPSIRRNRRIRPSWKFPRWRSSPSVWLMEFLKGWRYGWTSFGRNS